DVIYQVGRHHHAGARNLETGNLPFPQRRQRVGTVAGERGDLHEVERHLLAPDTAPAADEGLLLVTIFQAVANIALALIPEDTAHRKWLQRRDHAVVHLARRGFRHRPRLDRRTAPRAVDQPDRHAQLLLNARTEVVQRGREPADRVRLARLPRRLDVLRWLVGLDLWDVEQPNLRGIGSGDGLFRTVRGGERPLHVRLARANPDLANEDVFQLDLVLATDRQPVRLAIGLHGRQRHLPAPLGVGLCTGLVLAELHGHVLARIGPAPDRQRLVALQDHVTADHARQLDIGTSVVPEAHEQPGDGEEARQEKSLHGATFCEVGISESQTFLLERVAGFASRSINWCPLDKTLAPSAGAAVGCTGMSVVNSLRELEGGISSWFVRCHPRWFCGSYPVAL